MDESDCRRRVSELVDDMTSIMPRCRFWIPRWEKCQIHVEMKRHIVKKNPA